MNEFLSRLPEIATLRGRCRAMAMLDAVLSPEWGDRYYSFNCRWSDGEEMASMRDGSGNDWFIVFSGAGAYGRGFDHERGSEPTAFEKVPAVFSPYVAEPAFADHDGSPLATACFWREPHDGDWGVASPGNDGRQLFELLVEGTPEAYRDWAEDYYETPVSLAAVQHVYALRPLTAAVVKELNPDLDPTDLEPDVDEIGYPR
ncbi:hypothetical protein ACFXHA_25780 [Nocardia sp. NPDC059240]|uniref:hypothetical protein n=1 Tax=Nocardia sp. NPDC059240 TaxID=3346786 RepID=UPI0036C76867